MIETNRLIIRRFTPGDWSDLYEYLSDPNVVLYEPYEVSSQEACKNEAINRSKRDDFFAVCLKQNNKLIGNIYFSKQDFDTYELGYVFNANYQGHGYATEAAGSVMDYAFKNLNARRVVAFCSPKNTKSWRLLERLSMRREGHLKQNIYFKTDKSNNPIWLDTYEYAILSSEWKKFEINIEGI